MKKQEQNSHSEDSKSRKTSKLHNRFKSYDNNNDVVCPCFFGSANSLLWIIRESAGEGLWLLALVTCDL